MHFQVEVDEEAVLDCAESIMEALDIDGDGEITKVEASLMFISNFCDLFRMSSLPTPATTSF